MGREHGHGCDTCAGCFREEKTMFISIFGVPSALTSSGVHAIRLLFTAALGDHDIIYPATLEDLKTAWLQRTRKHIISFNELPHGELISFLKQADAPFIVFLKSGATVANELIKNRSLEPMDAIRTASICMSVLEEVARDSKALVIRSGVRSRNRLRNLMRKVMEFVGIELGPAEFTRLVNADCTKQSEPDEAYLEDLCNDTLRASGRGGGPPGVSRITFQPNFWLCMIQFLRANQSSAWNGGPSISCSWTNQKQD